MYIFELKNVLWDHEVGAHLCHRVTPQTTQRCNVVCDTQSTLIMEYIVSNITCCCSSFLVLSSSVMWDQTTPLSSCCKLYRPQHFRLNRLVWYYNNWCILNVSGDKKYCRSFYSFSKSYFVESYHYCFTHNAPLYWRHKWCENNIIKTIGK